MSVITVLGAAFCFAFPPLLTVIECRRRGLPLWCPGFYRLWAGGGFGGMVTSGIAAAYAGGWQYTASFGASGLAGLVLWWWSRRKRKRALRALGAKARARLAAMMRSMPRPSPRLVPQRVPA